MKYLKYLKYVIKHKWFVLLACFRRGLFFQGIIHDWSKFLPCEFIPYANFFYGKYPSISSDEFRIARSLGIFLTTKEEIKNDFNKAWLHHQQVNPHHWQYWILKLDSGETLCLEMPRKYALEMLADWEGAGLAITGKLEYKEWYEKNKGKMSLHENTRKFVEDNL